MKVSGMRHRISRKPIHWLCLGALICLCAAPVQAEEFQVQTASEFQDALDTAANNGEDDYVSLARGTYPGNFTYIPIDGGDLTIAGEAGTVAADIILDGGGSGSVLKLEGPASESRVHLVGLTLQNGTDSGLRVFTQDQRLNLTLDRIILRDNSTGTSGGGIRLRAGSSSLLTVDIRDTIIHGNVAGPRPEDGPGRGGGLSAYAGYGGGVIRLSMTNSIIARNGARATGGGLELNASEVRANNALTATVVNCTITGNESNIHDSASIQDEGGGIRVYTYAGEGATVSLNLYNTVLYGNMARGRETSEDLYLSARAPGEARVAAYHSDIGQLVDPLLQYQATQTISAPPLFFDPTNGDYHLRGGSPCIDAGTTELPVPHSLPAHDIYGGPRVIGGAPDIGADEARPPIYLPLLVNPST